MFHLSQTHYDHIMKFPKKLRDEAHSFMKPSEKFDVCTVDFNDDRTVILQTLYEAGPLSIKNLSTLSRKPYKLVNKEVDILLKLGFLKSQKDKIKFNVKVETVSKRWQRKVDNPEKEIREWKMNLLIWLQIENNFRKVLKKRAKRLGLTL